MATRYVSTTFSAATNGDQIDIPPGRFSFSLSGTFNATIKLQRQANGETDWETVSVLYSANTYVGEEGEGAKYRAICSIYTSGSPKARIGF